ncbi:MAG: hypothetical protein B6245_07675 [Desulfobacteraceae bacterium 4572_88]|nr:MAG: hypothetical protein B6245_07675 [Desulfobacteraceae bacterium 4572_88]
MDTLRYLFILICFLPGALWANDAVEDLERKLRTVSDESRIEVLNELAEAYGETSSRKSIAFGEQALELAHKLENKKEEANALRHIGIAYTNLSDYEKALEYHLNALKIREETQDKKAIADSLHHIGIVNDYMLNYDKALEYHLKALKIRKDIVDKKGIADSLNNVGIIYYFQSHYNEALEYYKKSLEIREEIGDKKDIAGSLNNVGVIYKEMLNYPNALEYYNKAYDIFREFGDKYESANILNNIGQVYYNMKNYDAAMKSLEQGLELAKSVEAKELVRENYEFHSDMYASIGNYQKALEYYKQSSGIKALIFTEESGAKIAEMQTKYETEKKEREIELLKKDNDINRLALEQQKLLRNSLIGGIGFVLVLVFVMFNRNRIIRKAHEELKKANDIIKTEMDKSDKLLLNILPVRVATDLKESGKTEPESFKDVTVFFSDIVNFTRLASDLEPKMLIDELNDIFTAFDNIIEKNGCERVKTIGDAYLCVCGMPEKNPKHAENVMMAAIEIIQYLEKRNKGAEKKWRIRVGIHTGKVVGGVVGVKKYIYDVFGDTINTASRMESNSEPMRINISEVTYHILKDKFHFIERDTLPVKGKGTMKMFFVADEDIQAKRA